MQANTHTFFLLTWVGDHQLTGNYPHRSISEPLNFIRIEMKTFKDYDIIYNSDTFEGHNGWELVYPN